MVINVRASTTLQNVVCETPMGTEKFNCSNVLYVYHVLSDYRKKLYVI